jgi:hypothetical protein
VAQAVVELAAAVVAVVRLPLAPRRVLVALAAPADW